MADADLMGKNAGFFAAQRWHPAFLGCHSRSAVQIRQLSARKPVLNEAVSIAEADLMGKNVGMFAAQRWQRATPPSTQPS